ncbi:MAG TPA: DUF2490 domain-containing protein [Pyrinomonadaceae bacterium]|nr:DUF2490 domain-containing protein [Pyrinomonadaceae bacterium]HMP65621.1 DUF2490 domain-containing protein [Pyrinomonadaceae bacterium]
MNRASLPFFSLIIISIVAFDCLAQDSADDDDFQVWSETTVVIPLKQSKINEQLTDSVSLFILGTLRLGQNRLYPVDRRLGFGFDLRLSRKVTLTPSYYFRLGEPIRNSKETEQRFRLDVSTGWKPAPVELRYRGRVEYRLRHANRDSVRLRNKLTARYPIRIDRKEVVTPFVANEVFFEARDARFSSNEFSVGISKHVNRSFSFELLYLNRRNRSGHIRNINGIGINLKFRLSR